MALFLDQADLKCTIITSIARESSYAKLLLLLNIFRVVFGIIIDCYHADFSLQLMRIPTHASSADE